MGTKTDIDYLWNIHRRMTGGFPWVSSRIGISGAPYNVKEVMRKLE